VSGGLTNKEVGAALDLSTRAVGQHLRHVYDKIGVTTRAAAAMFAMRHDLMSSDVREARA
jgi:DNA-binding CsgD family transcriptional regulator